MVVLVVVFGAVVPVVIETFGAVVPVVLGAVVLVVIETFGDVVVVVVGELLLATSTPVTVDCGGRGSVVPAATNPADTSELDPSLSVIGSATLTRLVSGSVFDQ